MDRCPMVSHQFGSLEMSDHLVESDTVCDAIRNPHDLIAVRKKDAAFIFIPVLLPEEGDYCHLSCRRHALDCLRDGPSGLQFY
jgi:hypothetical protein